MINIIYLILIYYYFDILYYLNEFKSEITNQVVKLVLRVEALASRVRPRGSCIGLEASGLDLEVPDLGFRISTLITSLSQSDPSNRK